MTAGQHLPTSVEEWRSASVSTLSRFAAEQPEQYAALRDEATREGEHRFPKTAKEWLDAPMGRLQEFASAQPGEYARLRDDALELVKRRSRP